MISARQAAGEIVEDFGLDYRSQRCCDLQIDLLCCSRLFRSITGETPSAADCSRGRRIERRLHGKPHAPGRRPYPRGDPMAWLREVVSRGVSAGAIEYIAGCGVGER